MAPSVDDVLAASWWPEFLKIKDTNTWNALATRFGVNVSALRKAVEHAGLTKVALPRGRKPRNAASDEVPEVKSGSELAPSLVAPEPTAAASPEDILRDLAGKRPDAEVAEEAGVAVEKVRAFRRAQGIAPYLKPPPGMVEPPPGTMAVEAPVAPVPTEVSPLEAIRDQLGTVGDQVLAEQIGVSRQVVRTYRTKLGIAAYQGYKFTKGHDVRSRNEKRNEPEPSRSRQEVIPFVEIPPSDAPLPATVVPIAAVSPTAATPPRRRGFPSKVDPFAHLLGTMSDKSISIKAGVSPDAVTKARTKRGIPAWKGERLWDGDEKTQTILPAGDTALKMQNQGEDVARASGVRGGSHSAPPMGETIEPPVRPQAAAEPTPVAPSTTPSRPFRTSKLDAYAGMLGTVLDSVVAKKAGVTSEAVRIYRMRHGIPSWTEYKRAQQKASGQEKLAMAPAEKMEAVVPDGGDVHAAAEAPVAAAIEAPLLGEAMPQPVVAEPEAPVPSAGAEPAAPAPASELSPKTKKFRHSRIDRFADLVGRLPAAEVARIAGVTVMSVYNYRRKRGIVMMKAPVEAAPEEHEVAKALSQERSTKHEAARPASVGAPLLVEVHDGVETLGTYEAEKAPPIEVAPETSAPEVIEAQVAPVEALPASREAFVAKAEEAAIVGPEPALLTEGPGVEREAKAAVARKGFAVVAKRGEQQRRFAIVARDIADAAARAVEMLATRTDGSWRVAAIGEIAEILE